VADRIDAAVDPDQPPGGQTVVDLPLGEARRQQLRTRDVSVLRGG
jgi:hypothetical protein